MPQQKTSPRRASSDSPRISPTLNHLYVATVFAAGLAVVFYSLHALTTQTFGYGWFMLAALTLVSGSFAIRLPGVPATISVSETFVFMLVLLYGAAPATIAVALDGLVITLYRRNRQLKRILFNVAEPAVSVWIASQVFIALAGLAPLEANAGRPGALILPMFALSTAYFLLNSGLTAIAVAADTGTLPHEVWRKHFMWLSLNYFGGGSMALLLVLNSSDLSLRDLGVILPLLVITYLTFKTSMARVEDANRHLGSLNKLYLSTVETLAMAIDAKDQITHGHIRRVQIYAVRLARAVGVEDEVHIRAIEAAALLHDMGKLAVPEHILNKPGRLTPAEYEKMKLHAPVGAEILSAIDFPYPVVPIVRHHHENWDGTGYPDGLKGLDIPIGARILAVVDCFDALTSERPYRRALSDPEAWAIIEERTGTMYDPQVVRAFRQVYSAMGPAEPYSPVVQNALAHIARSTAESHERRETTHAANSPALVEEVLWLCELWESVAGRATFGDSAEIVALHLRRLTPANLVAFFQYEPDRDEIVLREAAGFGEEFVEGIRLAVGGGLSGWVAAHRQTMVNSDPAVDLKDRMSLFSPRFESALSTPLMSGRTLVGVLTLYAFRANVFSDAHRKIVELLSGQIATALLEAARFEQDRALELSDPATGLPNGRHLNHLLNSPGILEQQLTSSFGFIGFSVEPARTVDAGEAVVRLAHAVRGALGATDIAFRTDDTEILVLMLDEASRSAGELEARVRCAVAETGGGTLHTARAYKPDDGYTLHALKAAVQKRLTTPSSRAAQVAFAALAANQSAVDGRQLVGSGQLAVGSLKESRATARPASHEATADRKLQTASSPESPSPDTRIPA